MRSQYVGGEGRRAAAVEVAPAAVFLGRLVDVTRECIRDFAAIARKRLEQQPLLPPHRRNHHEASRPARDGRCPDYCCCVLVAIVVIIAMPLPLLATAPLTFTRSPNGRVSVMTPSPPTKRRHNYNYNYNYIIYLIFLFLLFDRVLIG